MFYCALLAALVATCAAASVGVAQPDVAITLVGEVHGALPPGPCVAPDAMGATVTSLQDVGSRDPAGGSGSFELEIATPCVAPFYQALIARERLTARIAFTSYSPTRPDSTLVLSSARLTHVDLEMIRARNGAELPVVAVGIASQHVEMSMSTGSVMQAGATMRRHVGPFHSLPRLPLLEQRVAAWADGGVANVELRLSGDAQPGSAVSLRGARLSMTSSDNPAELRIVLDSLRVSSGAVRLQQLNSDHATIAQTIVTFVGADGTTGITVWLKDARVSTVAPSRRSPQNAGADEEFRLVARGLIITDISSGHTASTP